MDELLGYPTEYRPERIILAITEGQWAQYRRIAGIIRNHGIRVDELDPKACREAIPLAGDNAVGAIHVHGGGHANPQRTVQSYAWALQDLGGRVLQHTPALGIVERGGKVGGVETSHGVIACDHLVVAAGPQSEALLAPIGIRLPLASARAEMIVTEPLPLMRIGGCDGNGLYGRQTLRGNLAYGGGPHEWMEVEPNGPFARPSSPLVANLSRRLADLFPRAAHVRVIRSWAGVIENTPDGRPVIDRPADPGNVTVCTMSGVGFGLSPASGHAIRDLVLDGRCSFTGIEKLGLHRFANLATDWRERQGWLTPRAA
jgi:sarcosine oxidase subunit beta